MRTTTRRCAALGLLAVTALGLGACATVNPGGDYDRAAAHIEAATAQPFSYRPERPPADAAARAAQVQALLRTGLTADTAVQVCLLNNRRIQADLYEIGLARADLVQAGLLGNPTLSLGLRFPDAGGLANFEAALVQNIADLWQIPARQRAAQRTLDESILRIARQASLVAFEAKAAYYRARHGDRKRELATESVQVAQQVLELALARQQAGASSAVDVNLARSEVLDAQLALRAADIEAVEARADLARQLGLALPPTDLKLTEELPQPPAWSLSDEILLALAATHRLDLQAADVATTGAAARARAEELKLFPSLELGVGFERSERQAPEGRNILADSVRSSIVEQEPRFELGDLGKASTDTLLGPTLGLELPLFNQNQAGVARARYAYAQTLRLQEDLQLQVDHEVRLASARARSAWDTARFYREEVLPVREASLELARTAYQAGRTTLLNVLETERALLSARTGYADALQTSVTTLVELERVSGQPLVKLLGMRSGVAPQPDEDAPHGAPASSPTPKAGE